MSYVALATDRFDDVARFYGTDLGFDPVVSWDRPRGRGARFDLGGGLRLEILDNIREPSRLSLADPRNTLHIVVEVDDVWVSRGGLSIASPEPVDTSWGARLFQLRDPDGVPVTFLQWIITDPAERT